MAPYSASTAGATSLVPGLATLMMTRRLLRQSDGQAALWLARGGIQNGTSVAPRSNVRSHMNAHFQRAVRFSGGLDPGPGDDRRARARLELLDREREVGGLIQRDDDFRGERRLHIQDDSRMAQDRRRSLGRGCR